MPQKQPLRINLKSGEASQQRTGTILAPQGIMSDVRAFLLDCEAARLSPNSIKFYRLKLVDFAQFADMRGCDAVASLTPTHIREFFIEYGKTHSPGGIHAAWRAVRAFMRWLMREGILEKDPSIQVRTPKVDSEPLEPVSEAHVRALVDVCPKNNYVGLRDRAILMTLVDTGLRANELLSLNIGDVDLKTGSVLVRKGKNRKPRVTFVGPSTRKAILNYLRTRAVAADDAPLWVAYDTGHGTNRITYGGLRDMVQRRAKNAGIPTPTLHSFRRAFALTMLRNGADIVSLTRMMGHGSLPVLMRYLRQEAGDLGVVHQAHSPVESFGL